MARPQPFTLAQETGSADLLVEMLVWSAMRQKAQAYFERALEIGRAQQARSWEPHASLARLWRDQDKRAKRTPPAGLRLVY
jgi:hypothetical protein